MSRVLRPGGLISVSEFDFHVYDANHRRIERDVNDLTPPWWSVWFTHLWTAIVKSGGDVDAANHLHEWILDHPMFEDVAYKEIWVPAVPHTDTSNDSEEAKQLEKKLTDDGYVRVANVDFLTAHLHSCTRPSFVLVALSFWDMVLIRKSLA